MDRRSALKHAGLAGAPHQGVAGNPELADRMRVEVADLPGRVDRVGQSHAPQYTGHA